VGLILAIPGVPGPGIPIVVVALVILSERFAWAKRAVEWVRKRAVAMGVPERIANRQRDSDKPGGPARDRNAGSKTEAS